MSKKPDKSPPEDPKKANETVDADPVDENAAGKPLRRVSEGRDNLRQRAEWFRRREGGDK
jgi:hypothetical protein